MDTGSRRQAPEPTRPRRGTWPGPGPDVVAALRVMRAGLSGIGLLLAPGAGAGRDSSALVAIDERVTAAGAVVERIDFPYRKAGRRAPDREPVLLAAVRTAAAALAERSGLKPGQLVLGGRSMGGRMCSIVVASGSGASGSGAGGSGAGGSGTSGSGAGGSGAGDSGAGGSGALGLALVSYPLHPPGRPERLRTAHFPELLVPCVFISGTRDAFGTPAELERATAVIPAPVTHIWLEGKDHALRGSDARVAEAVADWLGGLVGT